MLNSQLLKPRELTSEDKYEKVRDAFLRIANRFLYEIRVALNLPQFNGHFRKYTE
jgi:hypothetical protein